MFGLTTLVIWLIGTLIWFAVLGWVYNDAEENGHGGCLWVLIVAIFGFLGLAIYLIFFHGFPSRSAGRRRPAGRGEDLLVRSQYRGGGQAPSGQWEHTAPRPGALKADPGFRDEDLDRLIEQGKFTQAREYLRDMKKLAKEMDDATTLTNYSQYEERIARASRQSSGGGSVSRY